MTSSASPSTSPASLAVMLSGGGRSLDNLLAAIAKGDLPARVALVIASRECLGAEKARKAGIPTLVIPGRIPAEELGKVLADHTITPQTGWVVLAGYLKLVTIPPGFEGRVVNIHPALLPKFGGPGMHGHHVHEAVIAAGEKESGCTVHLCDSRFDTGPIVLQRSCPVLPGDTPDTLAARVFEQECLAYPEALRKLLASAAAPDIHILKTRKESWGTPTTRVLIGIGLGAILIWSGVSKLINPDDARKFVNAITPWFPAEGVVRFTIGIEFLMGIWLISGIERRKGLLAFIALMLFFCGVLALAAMQGYQGSCGCFGSGAAEASNGIVRNLSFSLLAVMGMLFLPKKRA